MSNFVKLGFPNLTPNTRIDTINGLEVREPNNAMPVAQDLYGVIPGVWVEPDVSGKYKLCVLAGMGYPFVILDENNVTHTAIPFEPVFNASNELVGGRPPVNR